MKKKGYAFMGVLIMITLMTTFLPSLTRVWLVADKRIKEEELKFNLIQIKRALDEYYEKEREYPGDLDTLIKEGFLRRGYRDPNNKKNLDWKKDWSYEQDSGDIRSMVKNKSLEGALYTLWKPENSSGEYTIVEAEEEL